MKTISYQISVRDKKVSYEFKVVFDSSLLKNPYGCKSAVNKNGGVGHFNLL